MSTVSCLNCEGCVGRVYDFFSKSKVGVTASLVVEAVSLIIGILAITHILPGVGIIPGAMMISLGGFFSVLTIALVCCRHSTKETKRSRTGSKTDGPSSIEENQNETNPSPNNLSQSQSRLSQVSAPTTKTPNQIPSPLLPTSLYTCSADGVSSLQYWRACSPEILSKKQCDITQEYPVAASPEHGKVAFAAGGHMRQYIAFDDGTNTMWMDFQLKNANFMKPNVDTMLMCFGIHKLFQENLKLNRAIDIGAGSGFIAKYIALNNPNANVTAIDIDPEAGKYMHSAEAAMPNNVTIEVGDAITKLSQDGHLYDLVVSNPPYVPVDETQSSEKISTEDHNFWQGTSLISHMLEDTLLKMPKDGHLVMVVPSTALKSKRIFDIFQKNQQHFKARVLHQQEVAYKDWFAGNGQPGHLLATGKEIAQPTRFKGANLDLFVGITNPGSPRACKIEDGRREYDGYYWQMVYIIDFVRR
jgi:methylase of polypeptide subunit release factors